LTNPNNLDYDYIIIGSGFGGSVAALRMSEKGYKVLVLEKGKWFNSHDFPKSTWNLKKWLWLPWFKFHGFFKISFFRHVTVLSHVGVGGGSLGYATALPIPTREFFQADTWAHLANWEQELKPFYKISLSMLGAQPNPRLEVGDIALKQLAQEIGLKDQFEPTDVAIFFGKSNQTVADPYFDGQGPPRSGCNFCGGCMVGCRFNAKNSLDKNYLHLAQKNGAVIKSESQVYDVTPLSDENGSKGYKVRWKSTTSLIKNKGESTCTGVIFAGGVLGTVSLLHKLKKSSLPKLSPKIGSSIRTNSESLVGITTFNKETVFSDGVAIGSKLRTDKYTHLEPVRYPSGSGFWRILMSPLVHGDHLVLRLMRIISDIIKHPIQNFKTYFVWDWARRTQILLFMQTLDSTLKFSRGILGLKSRMEDGCLPTAFIPQAKELSEKYAKLVVGKTTVLLTETLLGRPTTAHIFGGAIMGKDIDQGVIDKNNRVFGYENMYVCDGSAISANPGVNPSLTITALTERAMSKIPDNIK